MTTDVNVHELLDGEVKVWVEQYSSIHLKSVTNFGDPVELTADDAKNLANILLKLAEQIKE